MPLTRRLRVWLIIAIGLYALLVGVGQSYAVDVFVRQLQQELAASFPIRLAYMMPSWEESSFSWTGVAEDVDRDLADLPLARPGPLAHCSARVTRVQGQDTAEAAAGDRVLSFEWQQADETRSLQVAVSCQRNWPFLLLGQGALVALFTAFCLALPRPPSTRQRRYRKSLMQLGIPRGQATRCVRGVDALSDLQVSVLNSLLGRVQTAEFGLLSAMFDWVGSAKVAALEPGDLRWFELALEQDEGEGLAAWESALQVARSPAELVFCPAESTVRIHGLAVKLPVTPFIYYYWYAMRRLRDGAGEGGGWFTNPASNRSDREHAGELVELMEAHQGHGKATRDLREKGLRSKILDQNRSKVKEHLASLLGEALAGDYLFEMERDPRTARFRYRIATDPRHIRVESTPECTPEGLGEIGETDLE
ncbi:hypothetical protein FV139_05850 [Parahaliea maris]|uniref:Uncharacterized protein n=1 Tax=Parahaliea maris TaxID=2716870 RepID=A0A5C9A5U5_9GAMM|nr:hypothetical protein [Parahaliea maris]TXS95409.1 hypothetical protein FV139_05850 [Parahaliea maris]